jgi:hypothetical protein
MWEPRCLKTLWASTDCYRDSLIFYRKYKQRIPFYNVVSPERNRTDVTAYLVNKSDWNLVVRQEVGITLVRQGESLVYGRQTSRVMDDPVATNPSQLIGFVKVSSAIK